jgi:hypothetical protein
MTSSNSVKPDGFKVPFFGLVKKNPSEIRKSLPKRETRSKTSSEIKKRFEESKKSFDETNNSQVPTAAPVEPQ